MTGRFFVLLFICSAGIGASLPPSIRFLPGPINGLLINQHVLVYGDSGARVKSVQYVLFTHARRDAVWAGEPFVTAGAKAIVPERERELFENPASFWTAYQSGRFHDYSQVNTKVLTAPLAVSQTVHGGETLTLSNVRVEVMLQMRLLVIFPDTVRPFVGRTDKPEVLGLWIEETEGDALFGSRC